MPLTREEIEQERLMQEEAQDFSPFNYPDNLQQGNSEHMSPSPQLEQKNQSGDMLQAGIQGGVTGAAMGSPAAAGIMAGAAIANSYLQAQAQAQAQAREAKRQAAMEQGRAEQGALSNISQAYGRILA